MRGEITVEKIGRPVMNKILVKVTDIFDGFKSKGGVDLINATHEESWADSDKYNITEFVIRYGAVVSTPYLITSGSCDYKTTLEVKPGDIVYWNSISFKSHTPIIYKGCKYLLVDYHELLLRIRDGNITPINGNTLVKPVAKKTVLWEYTISKNVTERWEITHKPVMLNEELNPANEYVDIWAVGDIVHLLVVDKPFKVDGDINRILKEKLYAVPLRMVLCAE